MGTQRTWKNGSARPPTSCEAGREPQPAGGPWCKHSPLTAAQAAGRRGQGVFPTRRQHAAQPTLVVGRGTVALHGKGAGGLEPCRIPPSPSPDRWVGKTLHPPPAEHRTDINQAAPSCDMHAALGAMPASCNVFMRRRLARRMTTWFTPRHHRRRSSRSAACLGARRCSDCIAAMPAPTELDRYIVDVHHRFRAS